MKRTILFLFALAAMSSILYARQGKSEGRTHPSPTCYLKAGQFLALSELDRVDYITGLMDGFYGVAMFGASDETVAILNSCTKDMGSKQVTAIIEKYVRDHPESWHLPLSVEAYNALNSACPGGLKPGRRNK